VLGQKIDVEKMSLAEADSLALSMGKEVTAICNEAFLKVNELLGQYGLKAKISIVFDELPNESKNLADVPKKRGRKAVNANLKKERA
jgi:phage-related minor tail protein